MAWNAFSDSATSSRQTARVASSPDCRVTTRRRARSANAGSLSNSALASLYSPSSAETESPAAPSLRSPARHFASGCPSMYWISMPNWVPQSPRWFCRITSAPWYSSSLASASPMIVVRRWPTCISLAMFGEEYSTTVRRPSCGVPTPSRSSASRAATCDQIASSVTVRLRKPGPASSTPKRPPVCSRSAVAIESATSRGFAPIFLASESAAFAWKSACSERRTSGSASANSGGSTAPIARATASLVTSSSERTSGVTPATHFLHDRAAPVDPSTVPMVVRASPGGVRRCLGRCSSVPSGGVRRAAGRFPARRASHRARPGRATISMIEPLGRSRINHAGGGTPMGALVWVLQILLAVIFVAAGLVKLIRPKADLRAQMDWVDDYSDNAVKGIGAVEVLAAIGLILPALTGIGTVFISLAAIGIVLLMIGAAITHGRRKEYPFVAANVLLIVLALIVAVARFGAYSL